MVLAEQISILPDLEAGDDIASPLIRILRWRSERLERPDFLVVEGPREIADQPVGSVIPLIITLSGIEERTRNRLHPADTDRGQHGRIAHLHAGTCRQCRIEDSRRIPGQLNGRQEMGREPDDRLSRVLVIGLLIATLKKK